MADDVKKWYTSKTLWTNTIAVIAAVAQGITGNVVLSPEVQVGILGLVNFVLRLITTKSVTA